MKTLFIDFDGTICFDKFWRNTPKETYEIIQEYLFRDNQDLVIDWMVGKHTSEEINMIVAKNTGLKYENIWDTFVHDCRNMEVDSEILKLIGGLRSKYYIVLITGNMDCFDRFTVPALYLDNYFDKIVNSFNEGIQKGDNGGQSFLNHLEGNIKNAILIEDSSKSRKVFEKLGGKAHKTTCKEDTLRILESLT